MTCTAHVRYEDDAPLKEWLDDMILAAKTVQDSCTVAGVNVKARPEVVHNKTMIAYGFRLPSSQNTGSEIEMGVVYPEEDSNLVEMRHKTDEVDAELTEAMATTATLERGVQLVMGILISRGFGG